MSYFSFNGERFQFHKNPEPAISRCNKAIEGYKYPDGYDEDVVNVCWGVVAQRAETPDPNADYRTHLYTLQDTGAIPTEDPEQEAREKRFYDRLEAIADSVSEGSQMNDLKAKELGMKIIQDPAWKWQAGMLDGLGSWRLVAEVYAGDWLMVAYGGCESDVEASESAICSPDWPDVRDPMTQLWMKDFAPVLVGEYLHAEREILQSNQDT